MAWIYPATERENALKIASYLGDFWTGTYAGSDLVGDIVKARSDFSLQTRDDIEEAGLALAHASILPFSRERWYPLALLESEMSLLPGGIWRFDQANPELFFDGSPAFYFDTAIDQEYGFPLPAGLQHIQVLAARLEEPGEILHHTLDFRFDTDLNLVIFRKNPFENGKLSPVIAFSDGETSDRRLVLWGWMAAIDKDALYTQFGHVLKLRAPSSPAYKRLISAVWDAIATGGAVNHVMRAAAATADIRVTEHYTEEVVDYRLQSGKFVVETDLDVYAMAENATVAVSREQILPWGSPLTDGIELRNFNQGYTTWDIEGLALGRGMLSSDFQEPLFFPNKQVAVTVTGSAPNQRVEWEIEGLEEDIATFWDIVHDRRVVYGYSLYELLLEEYGSIPPTVNPTKYLINNVLRNNFLAVRLKAGSFGADALAVDLERALRKIVPPHSAVLVLLELGVLYDSIILEDEVIASIALTDGGSTEIGPTIDDAEYSLMAFCPD